MEFDRQSIERHDFPTARRGYDPAAVDAHLRALAEWAQELAQRAAEAAEPSLGTTAAAGVQGILEAAQTTAAEIAREAEHDAQRTREDASREVEQARVHVDTLAQASAALLAQVQSLDGEVSGLARSLRVGREGGEARAVAGQERSEREGAGGEEEEQQQQSVLPEPPPTLTLVPEPASEPAPLSELLPAPAPSAELLPEPAPIPEPASQLASPPELAPQEVTRGGDEDLDGARLVALNMALSGEPREQTDRYLADSFQLTDRAKLLDEVYAAVEG